MHKMRKYHIFYVLGIIATAVALRVVLCMLGWTPINSDEAVMNLMALHIAERGEHPIFFYGQHYMGTFEAYSGAALFRIFGPSMLIMRLEMIAFYALFLFCLYVFTSKLYNCYFALLVLVLAALGSVQVLRHQIEAIGAYPELPFLLMLLFMIAYALCCHREGWLWQRRALLYVAWGFMAGLVLWISAISAPYIIASGFLIVWWCWRDSLKLSLWTVSLGFLMGAFPLIWYNFHAPAGKDTLTVALAMTQAGHDLRFGFFERLLGTIIITLPVATGYSSTCLTFHLSDHLPLFPVSHLHCIVAQTLWGSVYMVLLCIAAIMACIGIWYMRYDVRHGIRPQSKAIQESTRLMLLVGSVLVLVSYVSGGAIILDAVSSSRYLSCLCISLPVVIWPLWVSVRHFTLRWLSCWFSVARMCVIVIVLAMHVKSTASIFMQVPQAEAENRQLVTLIDQLEKMHITRFYSEYWTCNRLIFLSREKLICGDTFSVNGHLVHGHDRYLLYKTRVVSAKNQVFVYPIGDKRITILKNKIIFNKYNYTFKEITGYAIYRLCNTTSLV